VQFRTGTTVTIIETSDHDGKTLATGLEFRDADGEHRLGLTRDDLVFFTNGSLVQNSTHADTNTVVKFDRNTADRGCFTIWEKLAARDPKFGKPEVFLSDVEKSGWMSYYVTIKGDPTFFDYMEAKTGSAPNTGGLTAVVDSPWRLNFALFSKTFPDQPDDVQTLQGYAQVMNKPGSYIKKPMPECTGAEIFAELLYQCGLNDDQIERTVSHTIVHTYALPYIVAEFMPRRISDRPKVIPDGCVNLAFLGQFAEQPGEVVFTTEISARSAMLAVWGLTGLEKPIIPLPEPYFDVRVLALNVRIMGGRNKLTPEDLSALAGNGTSSPLSKDVVSLLNEVLNSAKLP
jgi:oleate hydratase